MGHMQHNGDGLPSSKRARTEIDSTAGGATGSASSGGFGEDMGPNQSIYMPKNFKNPLIFEFEQVHRFQSKGSAYTALAGSTLNPGLTNNDLIMVTPLATTALDPLGNDA